MLFFVRINIIKYLYKRDIAVNIQYISQRIILEKKYKMIDFFSINLSNEHSQYLITRYKQQNNIIYYLKIYLTYY